MLFVYIILEECCCPTRAGDIHDSGENAATFDLNDLRRNGFQLHRSEGRFGHCMGTIFIGVCFSFLNREIFVFYLAWQGWFLLLTLHGAPFSGFPWFQFSLGKVCFGKTRSSACLAAHSCPIAGCHGGLVVKILGPKDHCIVNSCLS